MKLRIILCFLLSLIPFISFTKTIEQLEKEIFRYNDSFEYEKTIIVINQYIEDHKSNHDYLVRAYILKSQTYKRLFNYEEVLLTLKLAEKEAKKTIQPDVNINKVQAEIAFALFDIHKYHESQKIMKALELKNFKGLPTISTIFIIMQDGYLNLLGNHLDLAEKKLNQALALARKYSPRDVPNILGKKLELYYKMGNESKMKAAFQEGIYYAKKYKILKYELYLYEIRKKIALDQKDYARFPQFQKSFDSLNTLYNSTENIGKLHVLEKKLETQKNQLKRRYENYFQTFSILLIAALIAFIVTLIKYNIINKAKRELAENEYNRIYNELSRITNSKNEDKIDLKDFDLTNRQLEIIQFIKEGKTNKEIANLLFISENTVKYHLKVIYDILDIAHRSELK